MLTFKTTLENLPDFWKRGENPLGDNMEPTVLEDQERAYLNGN